MEDDDLSLVRSRIAVEKGMEYDRWCKEIPPIQFPATWQVQVIPPYLGAVVRFVVWSKRGKRVSVYLDCYDNLGFRGSPYWEICPAADEDTERFAMADTAGRLIDGIKRSFRRGRR